MKHLPYYIVLLLAVFCSACDDYDSWTQSPSSLLAFSADTVRFDTLITGQSSTTRTLIVRNQGDKGLRIARVALNEGEKSLFRVNVDGQYLDGGAGEEFEVRRKDSIYVRAEVRLPESDDTLIHHYEDHLRFTLESGQTQEVTLVADGMNVYIIRGLTVKRDTTLKADRPLVVYDSLVVDSGATLTLAPGTTLMFHDGVGLDVHGTLRAEGTLERPITLRGDRVDRMFPYLPYDNTPNRWAGLHIYGESRDNRLTQVDLHSGDYGILCDSTKTVLDARRPTLTMTDCVVHNIGGVGLQLHDCVTQVVGTQVSNTLGRSVDILGGAHTFVHCTIAQYYPFDAARGDALYMANAIGGNADLYHHLYWAYFLNCVITGYADDVIMGGIVEGDELCDYRFANSLLRTVKSDDEDRFVNITYDNDKLEEPRGSDHFTLFDTDNFRYDFTPDTLSVIRGMADIEYTRQYSPVDRRGRSRTADGAPDAGAYEGKYE